MTAKPASSLFKTLFPGLVRLRHYPSPWFRSDLLAGVTVAAYLIPQCMAYGELAGVNPVQGLWAMLPAIVLYAMTGSSPQLSVGPESPTAMMTAAAVAPLVVIYGTSHATLAAALGMLVGVLCLVGYVARLGFLANLLSKPILIGYMTGVAVIMIMGQLSKVSGVPIEATSIAGQVADFLGNLDQIHWPTFILAGFVLVLLFGVQARFPRAPGPLLAVLLATAAVSLFHLDQYGVVVVGTIPAGLPSFQVPMVSQAEALALISAAAGIAIVGYSDNVLTARALAARNHYSQLIDPNQELLALGIANLGVGLFQGFPVSSSGSRAAIGNATGSKSQVFSLVAFGVVLLVLLFLRPLLVMFPTAALGALVIYAATRLVDLPEFSRLQRFRRGDYALAVLTTLGVLATDLLMGVAIAVGLSVIELFARIARPYDAVMGKVPDLPGLHDISDWPGATTIPGLVLYRYDAPLFFANANNFKRRALAAIEAEKAPVEWFILNAEAIAEIDITAADMLNELFDELAERGITFAMARVKQDLYAQLKLSGLLDRIGVDHIYFTLPTAIDGFHQRP
ncbi:sodium-independent anion transporter [Leptolyngbya sp. BL0902]|uniref:sulfate permease n=1 Tax=Leptolyngbya sp. BL0902 TaxID=1115757 RepID=UPI0019376204|nr:sulfate permease [Leptolyngbya sp. BL0902]QQE64773.1 sodium-independent anion transporter [Leptolyngbya sp. BL0902]